MLLETFAPEVTSLKTASGVGEALRTLQTYKPDLLFLDVVMPGQDGFDLLTTLEEWDFDVVFTTAYDQYAVRAIKYSALDYLLKPVDPDDLRKAIDRHLEKRSSRAVTKGRYQNLFDNLQAPKGSELKLAIPTSDGTYFYHTTEIIRCEADSNYTLLHMTGNRRLLSAKTLGDYDEMLSPMGFLRVHKSHLVNQLHVANLLGKDYLLMKDGAEVEVARRRKEAVKLALMSLER